MSFFNINAARDSKILQRIYFLEQLKKDPPNKKIKEGIHLWELIHEEKISCIKG